MKLGDLIEMLAGEVELAQPDLRISLDQLALLEADDPAFANALEQYSGVAQRMGEASEMAGFPGLQAVCAQVVENASLASALAPGERGPLVAFLLRWPELIVYYLRNLEDPSTAAGLVDHLRSGPSPLSEADGMKIAHMLGSLPAQISPMLGGAEEARPVLASEADVALLVPDDVDQKLLEGFFQEAPEQARYLVQMASNIAAGQSDSSELIAAKRVVHTMKGSGSIIGLRGLTSLGHHLEDILEHFERHGGPIPKVAADVLLDSAFCLEQMIGYTLGEDEYPQQAQSVLQAVLDVANRIDRGESLETMEQRVAGPSSLPVAQASAQQAPAVPSAQSVERRRVARTDEGGATAAPTAGLRVTVGRVDEMFRLSGEVSVHTAAMEARLKELTDRARELLAQNLRVQKRLFELETLVDVRSVTTLRARGAGAGETGAGVDRLELEQYSELHSTAHALFEEAADARALAQRVEEEIARTVSTQAQQRRLSRDLQHLVIGTRMTEVSVLTSRLQRNIRSTCQATGKMAELVLEGGGTLIDGDALNRLADPLLHVLRNAVDHGIETAPERRAAGKPESGLITLAFSRQGQQVVLRCIDDGRGLDYAAIRRRAVERGLLGAEQAATEEELGRMILMPGFSTRQTVSEVSGRGVGLDVVREWVAGMNGSIRISSKAGQGCVMELRFAASLSTMLALVVDACGQRFALPSVQIEQAVPRGVGEFGMVLNDMVYRHQKRVLPALILAEAAGVSDGVSKALDQYDAVIVRIDDKPHALAVDSLIDARELLIKNPGRYARHVRGVAGLSILGDGSIAVNLDVGQLVGQRGARRVAARGAAAGVAASAAPSQRELPGILIVDDSLSVRNSLLQLIQDAGFRAAVARDGVEAIDTMREFMPDLVLTDLEMPNMNGLELTSHIKGRADIKHLPVIMITSRSQEKHRRMAEQAGVDGYFTKPYNENDLLDQIRLSLAGVTA